MTIEFIEEDRVGRRAKSLLRTEIAAKKCGFRTASVPTVLLAPPPDNSVEFLLIVVVFGNDDNSVKLKSRETPARVREGFVVGVDKGISNDAQVSIGKRGRSIFFIDMRDIKLDADFSRLIFTLIGVRELIGRPSGGEIVGEVDGANDVILESWISAALEV